jgi:hypothetical protein
MPHRDVDRAAYDAKRGGARVRRGAVRSCSLLERRSFPAASGNQAELSFCLNEPESDTLSSHKSALCPLSQSALIKQLKSRTYFNCAVASNGELHLVRSWMFMLGSWGWQLTTPQHRLLSTPSPSFSVRSPLEVASPGMRAQGLSPLSLPV